VSLLEIPIAGEATFISRMGNTELRKKLGQCYFGSPPDWFKSGGNEGNVTGGPLQWQEV